MPYEASSPNPPIARLGSEVHVGYDLERPNSAGYHWGHISRGQLPPYRKRAVVTSNGGVTWMFLVCNFCQRVYIGYDDESTRSGPSA